jgi:predicted RNA-binding protein with PUA domain
MFGDEIDFVRAKLETEQRRTAQLLNDTVLLRNRIAELEKEIAKLKGKA